MATGNFEKCLKFVLQFEGGFVNHPADPGGATNLGITQATLSAFIGRDATIAEVKALTAEKVAPIYKLKYWDHVRGDELPKGIDLAVFDFAVHSGPSRGIIGLQRALNVGDDGKLGKITLGAAQKADPENCINAICDARMEFLKKLKVFKTFGPGLTNRVTKARKASLSLV